MNYLKDKTIIDFLVQVESLIQPLNTKFEPIYYFTLGSISQSYLKSPSALQSLLESFSMLHQYEESQAISHAQRTKLFIDLLLDPKGNLKQKISVLTSEEESKENNQPHQNSNYAKELRQKATELYEKAELKLAEHLALVEEEEDARMLPIDLFMWGFFTSNLQSQTVNTVDAIPVFEKLLALRQAQTSNILTHNQKMRLYIKLYNDWELDLNASITKLLQNPSLGSKPLNSLIVDEQKMNEAILNQLSLEEKARKEQEEFTCRLCPLDLYENGQDIFTMDVCLHNYHQPCLSGYWNEQILDKKFPVKCPVKGCKQEFSGAVLKELLSFCFHTMFCEAALDAFLHKNPKDVTYCPTPDCTYVFSLSEDLVKFECPNCLKDYCLKCQNRMHPGSCGDNGFVELAAHVRYKPCPSCKLWVEKAEGCDYMICKCGYESCYYCGQDYYDHRDCSKIFQLKYYEDFKDFIEHHERVKDYDYSQGMNIQDQPNKSFDVHKRENIEGMNRQARIQKKKVKR